MLKRLGENEVGRLRFRETIVFRLSLLLAPVVPACGPPDLGTPPAMQDAASFADARTEVDRSRSDGGTVSPCGEQNFQLERGLPPDLLVVLDRSGSMSLVSGEQTRWDYTVGAVRQTVASMQTNIKWGLQLFPTDDSCGVGEVGVPVGLNNLNAITSAIDMRPPDPYGAGFTPTTDAIYRAGAYMVALADANPKFILLATDGEPNCGPGPCACPAGSWNVGDLCCAGFSCVRCPDPSRAVAAIGNVASMGIQTFVIGIATADTDAHVVLNEMAIAGGRPRSGDTYYYAVANQGELSEAIGGIARRIVACDFTLKTAPFAPERTEVEAGGQRVPRDSMRKSGWDFGPNNRSVTFYGDWCEMLQQGKVSNLRVQFRCPPIG